MNDPGVELVFRGNACSGRELDGGVRAGEGVNDVCIGRALDEVRDQRQWEIEKFPWGHAVLENFARQIDVRKWRAAVLTGHLNVTDVRAAAEEDVLDRSGWRNEQAAFEVVQEIGKIRGRAEDGLALLAVASIKISKKILEIGKVVESCDGICKALDGVGILSGAEVTDNGDYRGVGYWLLAGKRFWRPPL